MRKVIKIQRTVNKTFFHSSASMNSFFSVSDVIGDKLNDLELVKCVSSMYVSMCVCGGEERSRKRAR